MIFLIFRIRLNLAQDVKSRDGGNTILQKMFPGGSLTITGSNSAPALASMPIRYVLGDERDRWADSAGTEGDLQTAVQTFLTRICGTGIGSGGNFHADKAGQR